MKDRPCFGYSVKSKIHILHTQTTPHTVCVQWPCCSHSLCSYALNVYVVLQKRWKTLRVFLQHMSHNRAHRRSGFPTFISCQRQDANVLPKRQQSHQGDKLCDVSTVPLVARWPVFLARGSDADGEPHCTIQFAGCKHVDPQCFQFPAGTQKSCPISGDHNSLSTILHIVGSGLLTEQCCSHFRQSCVIHIRWLQTRSGGVQN